MTNFRLQRYNKMITQPRDRQCFLLKNQLMDNSTIIETLVNAYAAGNNRAFARMLGVSYQTITNWKRPERTLDYPLIYEKCENLSGDWLLSGRGELFRTPLPDNSQTASAKGKQAMATVIRDINLNAKDSNQAKIALLEKLLEEKERLIQILLSQRNSEESAK